MTLTDRELATLIWLVVLVVVIGRNRSIRASVAHAISILLGPKVLTLLVLFVLWMVGVVWLASQLPVWGPENLKDTLLWAPVGAGLWIRSIDAAKEPKYFTNRVRDAIAFTVFLEVYLNTATFGLAVELIVQPVLALAVMTSTLGAYRSDHRNAKRLADGCLVVVLLVLLVPPTAALLNSLGDLEHADIPAAVRGLLLSVWLSVGALPFIYALSLLYGYEGALNRMRWQAPNKQVPLHAKMALFRVFHFRTSALAKFGGNGPWRLARATSYRDAVSVIRQNLAREHEQTSAARRKAEELERYAGVEGVDGAGRRFDKREFEETIESLENIAATHIAWYHRGGRYGRNLLRRFEGSFGAGLPDPHGIEMTVRRDGQAWYAWRRTASGWCFASGAAAPPPDQWFYDGPDPPDGYPGTDPDWASEDERSVNWDIESYWEKPND